MTIISNKGKETIQKKKKKNIKSLLSGLFPKNIPHVHKIITETIKNSNRQLF